MKARKMSHVPLIVGLALGLLIMWFGASPAGASGDLVTGGWDTVWLEEQYTAANKGNCTYCDGTYTAYCWDHIEGPACTGGTIEVLYCVSAGEATGTSHSGSSGVCSGSFFDSCNDAYNGSCY